MKKTFISKIILIGFLVSTSISCATTNEVQENKRKMKYEVIGTFDSKFHSDGKMNFVLFDDGTLEGDWITENKTVTIKATGYYIIKNDEIVITASGLSMLRSSEKSRVIIISSGKIKNLESYGQFMIVIDELAYTNDTGTWDAKIVKAY